MNKDNDRVLICASTLSHIRNFHMPYIRWFREQGYEVDTLTDQSEILSGVACAYSAPFTKKLWHPRNLTAIVKAKNLINAYNYRLIVTNTTLAGAVARAAVILSSKKKRPVVCHIPHGYFFDESRGLKKSFYLIPEKIFAHVTDTLIEMNEVDMRLAQAHHLSNDKIAFVHGMGVDLKLFQDVRAHNSVRTDQDNFTFFYAAEFSKRKNHAFLLHAFEKSCEQMEKAMLCLAGQGALFESCRQLAKCLNIEDRVRFLGHVDDIPSRLASFDAVISASLSEGLPFNIIEAMAAGLPIIASDIKGHRDLLSGTPGELYRDETELIDKMVSVYNRGRCRVTYDHVVRYGLDRVMDEIISIYKESLRTS